MQIEVNGTKYEPRSQETNQTKPPSPGMQKLVAMASMYGGFLTTNGGAKRRTKKRPSVDIVKEYGLIQLKKSKLSRSERDWVVHQFEKTYKKVEE